MTISKETFILLYLLARVAADRAADGDNAKYAAALYDRAIKEKN